MTIENFYLKYKTSNSEIDISDFNWLNDFIKYGTKHLIDLPECPAKHNLVFELEFAETILKDKNFKNCNPKFIFELEWKQYIKQFGGIGHSFMKGFFFELNNGTRLFDKEYIIFIKQKAEDFKQIYNTK
jgi:hypothetical protein